MNQRQALSPKFNLSLGFLPGAIAVFAGFFIQPETALYTGAGIGLALSLICWQIRPLLLYGTTGALLALVFFPIPQEESWFPLLVESVVFAPTLLLLLFGRKWIDAIDRQRHRLIQSIEAAIVSARILFILVLLHGVFALILSLFAPDTSWRHALLCRDMPFGILLTPILLNQIGLYYFNKRLKRIRFIPVVNTQGVIIGKKPLLSAVLQSDNTSVYPIVRIAITAYNMLHLSPRPQDSFAEQGKTDLSLEDYLLFGESVKQAARRILHEQMPQLPSHHLHYHFKHYYRDNATPRLVYLFTLELENDELLPREGKLWTFRQIEQNLGKHYFSKFLEQEYKPLKNIIYTREKYKESWRGPANAPAIP